ncbi:MAG TPA: Gfo/Idh/MocA family oxidoreductase [Candidatus Saccharimonadales bacterium]|nr:Gfo/Idh/MocA family oxidoreductase [Candidatus Saccharimonadales bacterium]
MERIQYGVIGCGEHALQSHAVPNKNIAELALNGVYDLSEERMNRFVDEAGNADTIQRFTTREELLRSTIGAVLIGTPDDCHFNDLGAAVKAGKHVFVEKPLAVSPAELEALPDVLKEAEQNGLIVSSCHPRRYDLPYVWLKNHLSEFRDTLGEPLQVKTDFSYHKPVRNWKHDRGLLLDHANHEIDLVNFLFGHSGFDATRLTDSYDRYRVAGIRDDGISFDFSGTRRLNAKTYPEWAGIRFETGEVTIDTHKGFARIIDHETGQENQQPVPVTAYEERGAATMENFDRAILGLAELYLSLQDLYVNTALSVTLTNQKTWKYDEGNV